MKKCASCTKDLPDAALHCVFCGAKQPPAPAVHQGLAKTAFGYSAGEVAEQLRQQGRSPAPQGRQAPAAAPYTPPPRTAPSAVPPMPVATAPTMPPPRPRPPTPPPPSPPAPSPAPPAPAMQQRPYPVGPQGGFVPASGANAKTIAVVTAPAGPLPVAQPMPAIQPTQLPASYPQPSPAALVPTFVPPPPQQLAVPMQSPMPAIPPRSAPPIMAIPAAQPPPYLSSQTGSRVIRPIDPWQDSLRAMMFLWGLALLAAFATPLATQPALQFQWTQILEGAGLARLPPLTLAAIGLLSVIVAVIPMPTAPRGLIATVLGLAGIAVPIALASVPSWQALSTMIGALILVPGLLVRDEYRDTLLARLLVTLGALGILLPQLIPQQGAIPLVSVFKSLIELPGTQKVEPALLLGLLVVVVVSLLAWLPSPATGATKLWAWLVILWALVIHVTHVLLKGNLGDAVTAAPNTTLLAWVAGGGVVIGSAYLVLVGYGLACVLGRQLE